MPLLQRATATTSLHLREPTSILVLLSLSNSVVRSSKIALKPSKKEGDVGKLASQAPNSMRRNLSQSRHSPTLQIECETMYRQNAKTNLQIPNEVRAETSDRLNPRLEPSKHQGCSAHPTANSRKLCNPETPPKSTHEEPQRQHPNPSKQPTLKSQRTK